MYLGPVKRKKINLWLLILLILFVIAIVFTFIHMSNSSRANSDSRYSNEASNSAKKETNGSTIGIVNSYDSFSDIAATPGTSNVEMYNEIPTDSTINETPKSISLNNHTYDLKNIGVTSLKDDTTGKYIELKKSNLLYKITTEKNSFTDVLHKDDLKDYIEKTFKVQVTSELKTGTVNDIQMIICTIADRSSVGYFIITPLNDSEILSFKIQDANNSFALIQDLSEPISDIGLIKTNIE